MGAQAHILSNLLPPLRRASRISLGPRTLLLMAGGFEERAGAIARLVRGDGGAALLLRYLPDDTRNRLAEIAEVLAERNVHTDEIVFDRYSPGSFPLLLATALRDGNVSTVVLDISGMSKIAILLCMEVCRDLDLNLTIVYAEARQYGPSRLQYEEARARGDLHQPTVQLYTGVHGVIRVPALSSVAMQGQPAAAIAFMSFNEQLTQALVNSVYPSRLLLINGSPPRLRWRAEATAWIHEQLRREWPPEDNRLAEDGLPERRVSTLDYRQTADLLTDLYWSLAPVFRVLLAPTGSKMQTVGCFLARAMHPDLHIEYPTPQGFLDAYSKGVGKVWMVRFPSFGKMMLRLRHGDRRQRLQVEMGKSGIGVSS